MRLYKLAMPMLVASAIAVAAEAAAQSSSKPWWEVDNSFTACTKSHETGVYATPAFRTDTPRFLDKLYADALVRWGSVAYVDCTNRATREEAEQAVARAYGTTVKRPWPLPWLGGQQATAPAPKPAAAPKPTAALTVKTDTSAKDAAKAWDEQVKKSLAAEAQKKVEAVARQAQADAKYKAQVEAFFAERRKQGRAQ